MYYNYSWSSFAVAVFYNYLHHVYDLFCTLYLILIRCDYFGFFYHSLSDYKNKHKKYLLNLFIINGPIIELKWYMILIKRAYINIKFDVDSFDCVIS